MRRSGSSPASADSLEPSTADIDGASGLSKLQKEMMQFVHKKGYITAFDASYIAYNQGSHGDIDLDEYGWFKKSWKHAYATASRSLRRLVERGLLVRLTTKWRGCVDVFTPPDFTDDVPYAPRRLHSIERCLGPFPDQKTFDAACENVLRETQNG